MSEVKNSAFAEALAKKKQAEKEKEEAEARKASGGFGDYEQLSYFALEDGEERVFRILGNPVEVRSLPTDPKLILQSQIVNEQKTSYLKINWPVVEKDGKAIPDPNWILSKLYGKVLERKWLKYTDADVDGVKIKKADGKIVNDKGQNGRWDYLHEMTTVYGIIEGNAKVGEKFPKSFYPSKRVVMNVINRHDDWCKNNKHTQILTSKLGVSRKKDSKTGEELVSLWPDTGIPATLYDKIFSHFIEYQGDWDIDAVVVKKADDKSYDIFDAKDTRYLKEIGKQFATEDPLTDEEKSYEMYDLDKLFGVSSYNKLLRKLKHLFQLCDAELHTDFLKELEDLANKESAERSASDIEEADETGDSVVDTPKVETKEVPSIDVSTEEKLVDYFKTVFPMWDAMSDTGKNIFPDTDKQILIKGFEAVSKEGLPVFRRDSDPATCTNTSCTYVGSSVVTETPSSISMCPVCGEVYPEQ